MSWNAHVWLKWKDDYDSNDWNWLKDLGNVKRAWSTMGDWDCCLEVDVSTPTELEEWVWNKLKKNEWVGNTHSTWSKELWNGA